MFHKDKRGRKGGGVALYVKDSLKYLVNNSVKTNMDSESV